ncbi:hypothetical protein BLNAU_23673 [Blattamonas nauphoetae]|uniref:Protein kinase domain-containing protein n=1 Tax=Blattamonas nauphoetae TaxID=2049346 RepID=A0ABQ9WTR4_9EUKA|nr:hypothetical protein BLNAU_23673 [Blattamonas nauphoetae]
MTALESVEGTKVAAQYTKWDKADQTHYDSRVDIWAIGLILHEIAYGKSIFGNANDIQTTKKILDNKFDITQYDPLHPKFHAILKRMLSTDADARPTAASLLQDPQLQPAYNFLTSVPAVLMIKTNASSILNSAIPQETFPDDLRTRQNRFVQSMASPQAAENVAISVDSASPTESTTKPQSSFVAGVLVVGALVAGVFAGDGSLLAVELLVAVVAGALGAAALGARALVAIALVAGALVARVVEGACSLFQGKCVIGPLVAGVASGALVARLVAEPLGAKRVLGAGALVAGALVSGVVADELASGSVERQYGVGALVAGALATGVLVAGVLVAGVVAGAHVQGVRGAGALGAGALVAGTFAAGAILAEVVQRAPLQEQALLKEQLLSKHLSQEHLEQEYLLQELLLDHVTGPLGAGTLTAGARVVGALL